MTKFLYKEYEECFKQLRFYDERQSNFIKYVTTISSLTGTILLGFMKYFEDDMSLFLIFQSIISFIVFICLIFILLSMIQNRLYFTFVARQINAIRKYLLENESSTFKDNQMYLSTDFSAFKLLSVQTLMIFGVSFVSSIYISSSAFSLLTLIEKVNYIYLFIFFILILLCQILFSYKYLIKNSEKKADEAIHFLNNNT